MFHVLLRDSTRLLSLTGSVSEAVLNLILSRLDLRSKENEGLMTVVNHIATGCALLAMVSDVIKMSFGLDPALSVKDFYKLDNFTS
ncbi:hypothetical protein RUM44_000236 [Polyplax serrata]|uniref:Uncharacterized protein n=1 Tax=Polyplax serrata TaxID=468196 RepID=A0ABR1B4U8_POLSC